MRASTQRYPKEGIPFILTFTATAMMIVLAATTVRAFQKIIGSSRGRCSSSTSCRRIQYQAQGFSSSVPLKYDYFCRRNQDLATYRLFSSTSGTPQGNSKSTITTTTTSTTIRQAYSTALRKLQQQGISEPEWSTVHLLATAIDLPWSSGFSQLLRAMEQQRQQTHNVLPTASTTITNKNNTQEDGTVLLLLDQVLTQSQYDTFQGMIARRLQSEPLQYILGKWDVWEYDQWIIRPPLLCPRPETEELIDLVLDDYKNNHNNWKNQNDDDDDDDDGIIQILDVGCGTGIIGIALADKIPKSLVTAIDIEPIAIETSMENAQRIFVEKMHNNKNNNNNYVAQLCRAQDYKTDSIDILVSNPPYIPRRDMATLEADVIRYESAVALCGDIEESKTRSSTDDEGDGMDVIRIIVEKWAQEWSINRQNSSVCWMEVDPSQPEFLEAWLLDPKQQERLGGVYLNATHQDMSGRDRFVKLAFR